jgi:SAM-dependent methyltransferase
MNSSLKKDGGTGTSITLSRTPDELEYQERERFDMEYGTNTHLPLAVTGFHSVANLEHGKAYMASWTSEIRTSFARVTHWLDSSFSRHTFIDIGCGKGKVPIVWRLECQQRGLTQRICGIDYYPPFIRLARANHQTVFATPGEFIVADAAGFDYAGLGTPLIVYLYNPFDAEMLSRVLRTLRELPTLIVYNIPTHAEEMIKHGFRLLESRQGGNQNEHTMLFSNRIRPT